ncbi:MAG: zinc-ribbon domain containing protein [Candidatus Peregrinibacteria bacterium]
MQSEKQRCSACNKDFLILPQERKFYEKKDLPDPTQCPACRQDARLAMRNERKLYKRTCDKCHESIISPYSSDSPYKVYCQKCFWEYVG